LCHLDISVTTQSGVEYSLDGTTYQASNTFSGLASNNIPYTLEVLKIIAALQRHQQWIYDAAVASSSCYSNGLKYNAATLVYHQERF
jgi:hypothetical protein